MDSFPEVKVLKYEDIRSCLEALATVVSDLFGSNLGKVLMAKETGEVAITNDAVSIFNAISVSHPVARLLIQACCKHHRVHGDNGKACFLMIYSALSTLCKENLKLSTLSVTSKQKVMHRHKIILSLNWFANNIILSEEFLTWSVNSLGIVTPFSQEHLVEVKEMCRKIISTFFTGKFSADVVRKLSEIVLNILWKTCNNSVSDFTAAIEYYMTHFDNLVTTVPGILFYESTVVKGILLDKELSLAFQNCQQRFYRVAVVMFDDLLQPSTDVILNCNENSAANSFLSFPLKLLWLWLKSCLKHEITLVFFQGRSLESFRGLCEESNVCLVNCITEDESEFLCSALNVKPLLDITDPICENNTATVEVKEIQLANQVYTIVTPQHDIKSLKTLSTILCSPSPGLCSQYKAAVYNALLVVRGWLYPIFDSKHQDKNKSTIKGVAVKGGGLFQIELYKALSNFEFIKSLWRNVTWTEQTTADYDIAWRIFSEVLLVIPKTLHSNSFQTKDKNSRFITQLSELLAGNCNNNHTIMNQCTANTDVYEPMKCQMDMLQHVLNSLVQILRIDSIVSVHRRIASIAETKDCVT